MRILTWNVTGDSGNHSLDKVNDLNKVIQHWDKDENKDEVVIICLQELSVEGSCICQYLNDNGWDIKSMREQPDKGGKVMAIAVRRGFFEFQGDAIMIDLREYMDRKIIASTPIRCPMYVVVKNCENNEELAVFTWHATLGSCKWEHFIEFSRIVDGEKGILDGRVCSMRTVIAADMNNDMSDEGYYEEFSGVSDNLDHILGRGVEISDGFSSKLSYSTHPLVSAHFE